jgi:hypothetical protein
MFIKDPYLDFLPIPDPGVKKTPDPGSGSLLKCMQFETLLKKKNFLSVFYRLDASLVPKEEKPWLSPRGESSSDSAPQQQDVKLEKLREITQTR